MILRFILWYLKRYKVVVRTHGKYGWEDSVNFYDGGNFVLKYNSFERYEEDNK